MAKVSLQIERRMSDPLMLLADHMPHSNQGTITVHGFTVRLQLRCGFAAQNLWVLLLRPLLAAQITKRHLIQRAAFIAAATACMIIVKQAVLSSCLASNMNLTAPP
jgi:hypothetical protein